MSENYRKAGPSGTAGSRHGSQVASAASGGPNLDPPPHPLSTPVQPDHAAIRPLRQAHLPAELPEPPRRPADSNEAWMQDALRSIPPAAQREAMRHHRRTSAMSNSAGVTVADRSLDPTADGTGLSRTRSSGASIASRNSARDSSHSTGSKEYQPGWMAKLGRATGLRPDPSSPREEQSISSPKLHSPDNHLISISKTKAARKAARRDARRAKRAAGKQHRSIKPRLEDDDDDDEIITLDGIEDEQQARRLRPIRSQRNAAQLEGDIVGLPDEPPLDVPEANVPTATALAQAAKAARKPRRKLQFAPEQKRVRKVDLPDSYEAGDLYRGLEEYVEAARERRRKQRKVVSRRSRRRAKGSRGSRSSAASSKTSDGSSSSSSSSSDGSSSSSSSSSGHGLTIARLRAFFGDSSSSSSSSDSDSDSSTSSSDSSSTDSGPSSSANVSNPRRRRTRSRTFSMSRGSRSRRLGRSRSKGDRSEDSDSDAGSPTSSRAGPLTPYLGPLADLQIGRKNRTQQQRKRARKAAKRAKKREAQLIKEGRLPPKPSRNARAKAARAREMAGGITEYQLFTPMMLPMDASLAQMETVERPPATEAARGMLYRKTMRTTSWEAVRNRFHLLRHYLKQVDGQGGDLGVTSSSAAKAASSDQTPRAAPKTGGRDPGVASSTALQELSPLQLGEADFLGGDLSLPPPALDLPLSSQQDDQATTTSNAAPTADLPYRPLTISSMLASMARDHTFELPGDQEMEGRTGVRMSDLPLSPNFSVEFGKDFGRSPRAFDNLPSASLERMRDSPPEQTDRKRERPQREAKLKPSKQQRYGPLFDGQNGGDEDGDGGPGSSPSSGRGPSSEGAWWLNVQCPTYKDMQEISKLFPLHPLTVEDVLQQDPREKVDVFDKLGYYFVVIRAIDERYFRYTSSNATRSPGGSTRGSEVPQKGSMPSSTGSVKAFHARGSGDGSEATAAGTGSSKGKSSPKEKDESHRSGQPSLEMEDLGTHQNDAVDGKKSDQGSSRDWHASDRGVTTTMTRKVHVEIVEGIGGKEGLEGVSVGANNLYLIVFAHGVISFSFDDVSKHTDRVLRRLLEITQPVELTADWIAHGLYDSVVDAFFPLLSFVQMEVVEIEELATDPVTLEWSKKKGSNLAPKRRRQRALMGTNPDGRLISVEPVLSDPPSSSASADASIRSDPAEKEKASIGVPQERMPELLEVRRLRTVMVLRLFHFVPLPERLLERLPWFMVKRRQHVTIARLPRWEFQGALEEEMRKTAAEIDEAGGTVFDTQAAADQSSMLHRIADTRKIVTGLSRLLGPKNDAVKGLRKRLADLQQLQRREESSLGDQARGGRVVGAGSRTLMARTEVSMYMSDVHDHILSMLYQLGSGEGRLSEIHFSYLSQIDINNRKFRQGTDGVIVLLAAVTVAVFGMQLTTSLFSLNIRLPYDGMAPTGRHLWWWTGILLFILCIPFAIYLYTVFLLKQSRRRLANKKAAR